MFTQVRSGIRRSPGEIEVRIVNPIAMMQMGDLGSDEAIANVASDATERLRRVADALSVK